MIVCAKSDISGQQSPQYVRVLLADGFAARLARWPPPSRRSSSRVSGPRHIGSQAQRRRPSTSGCRTAGDLHRRGNAAARPRTPCRPARSKWQRAKPGGVVHRPLRCDVPARRGARAGDFAWRSSFCATPFLITKLPVKLVKVRLLPAFRLLLDRVFEPRMARAWRSNPRRRRPSTRRPSRRRSRAVQRFLERRRDWPVVVTSSRDVTRPPGCLVRCVRRSGPTLDAGELLFHREAVAVRVHAAVPRGVPW